MDRRSSRQPVDTDKSAIRSSTLTRNPTTPLLHTAQRQQHNEENARPNIIRKTPSAPALVTAKTRPPAPSKPISNGPATTTTLVLSHHRRPALQTKDRNVVARNMPAATATRNSASPARPPPKKPSLPFITQQAMKAPATNSARQPQMPTLAKNVGRAPLTPKIAGVGVTKTASSSSSTTTNTAAALSTTPQQPPQQQRANIVVATTPLPRRTARPDAALSNSNESSTPRDDLGGSPAPAFFAHANITPRSGKRQSRLDSNSASSTPTGTPQPESSDSWHHAPRPLGRHGDQFGDDAEGESSEGLLRRQAVTFSPVLAPHANGDTSSPVDSKFFYASGASAAAKSPQTQPLPTRAFVAPPLQKASTFCYANGASMPVNPSSGPSSGVAHSASPVLASPAFSPLQTSQPSSKFVYANGIPDVLPSSHSTFTPPSRPASTLSVSSRITTNRTGTVAAPPSAGAFALQRPVSPLKQPSYTASKPPSLVGGRLAAAPSFAQAMPASNPLPIRKSSNEITPPKSRPTHSRAGSLVMADPTPVVARVLSSHPSSQTSSPTTTQPAVLSSSTMGFTAILQAAEDLSEADDDDGVEGGEGGDDDSQGSGCMRSPTKSNPLDELVMSARRERKVQDLEITNASLEAINRTLERQLRKQTAELRRYKRLSRSGRLSLASMDGGRRIVSDATIHGPLMDPRTGLDDLSEEDAEPDDDEDGEADSCTEDSFSSEYDGSGGSISSSRNQQLSPSAIEMRDARHRRRDEKRLLLDLSKHHQLLVDSQKINQSLKRCIGWTEELIREGRRALEYHVRVSEVELGGHVLVRPDDEDDAEEDGEQRERDAEELRAVVVDFGHGDVGLDVDTDGLSLNSASGALGGGDGGAKEPAVDRDSGVDLPGDAG